MAEKAQQEPTMEEILASIRKIIADDDQGPRATPTAASRVVDVRESDEDTFDDLDLNDDAFDMDLPDEEERLLAALTGPEPDTDMFEAFEDGDEDGFEDGDTYAASESFRDDAFDDDAFDLEEGLDEVFSEAEPSEFEAAVEDMFGLDEPLSMPEIKPAPEPEPEPMRAFSAEPTPIPTPKPERTPMSNAALADNRTVDAAASSLGKLLSKVEVSEPAAGSHTIEGMVREMLRPMLKEWLDENLPAIVDKHVEAEVRRIASRAG